MVAVHCWPRIERVPTRLSYLLYLYLVNKTVISAHEHMFAQILCADPIYSVRTAVRLLLVLRAPYYFPVPPSTRDAEQHTYLSRNVYYCCTESLSYHQ